MYRSCVCHPLSMTCTIFFILLAVFLLIGTVIIITYYAEGYFSPNKNVDYGPGDTQDLFFSSLFCEELSTNKDTLYSSSFLKSTLYLLREPPALLGEVEVSFQDIFTIYDVHQRNFHLFPGSVISLDVCADNNTHNGVGTFYLVKGRSTYEEWLDDGQNNNPQSVASLHVWDFCKDELKNSISYNVTEEDQYYLMFINDRHITPDITKINANYTIQRQIYKYNESSIVNSCSFTTTPCSLKMPFQHITSVLLTYGEPLNWAGNWSNSAISIDCVPRVWFYTVLTALGLLLIAISTFLGCVGCCCCTRLLLSKDAAKAPLLNQHTGILYDTGPSMKEMDNPSIYKHDQSRSKYSKASNRYRTPIGAVKIKTVPNRAHPPPSFKRSSGSYTRGLPPTYETFTR